MAYGVFEEVRDLGGAGLRALNDHLRYLYGRVQGGLSARELDGDLAAALGSMAGAEEVERQGIALAEATAPEAIRLAVGGIGGGNLVKNGGFAFGWKCWDTAGATAGAGRTGGTCAAFTGAGIAAQTVPFPTRGRLTASCWAAADALDASGGFAGLRVDVTDGEGVTHRVETACPEGTQDWSRLVLTVDAADWPGGCVSVRIQGVLEGCAGGARFDDFQLEEGDAATAWTPHASEISSSAVSISDDAVDIHTPNFTLTLAEPGGDAALVMGAGALGWNRIVTRDLTVTGRVSTDADGNIDVFQGSRTLYVGPQYGTPGWSQLSRADASGAWPEPSYFANFATAMASLGRRLKDATVRVYVQAGTWAEALNVDGFFGRGSLVVYLRGGADAMQRAVFLGGAAVQYNAVPVTLAAWDNQQQSNNAIMPLIKGPAGGRGLNINANAGAVYAFGLCIQAGSGAHAVNVAGGTAHLRYCCMEGAGAGWAGLGVGYGSAYAYNCTGSNAGAGVYLGDGGHLIRRGTVPTGTPAITNAAGAYHDSGTVTPTASPAVPVVPTGPTVKQYACDASGTYRAGAWSAGVVSQGDGGGGACTGCFAFNAAAELYNRAIASARLYLKRTASGGAPQALPLRLWTAAGADTIPPPGGAAPMLALGGENGATLGYLAWNAGGWFDIPVYFALQACSGLALAIYDETGEYLSVCGMGVGGPVLEVTYL